MDIELLVAIGGLVGSGSLINFFVQRHFAKKDAERHEREIKREKEFSDLKAQIKLGLETIKLLSYARVAEEADRLIAKKYATQAERLYIRNLHDNYKKWGWNGDMNERMHDVFNLPPEPETAACVKECGNQCLKNLTNPQ